MGFFSKKPTVNQINQIESAIFQVQTNYKTVTSTDRVDWFIEAYENTYAALKILLDMQNKYPSYFGKNSPSSNLDKINSERKKMEREFIDRFITSIENKLLKYSTPRGKINNFIQETDKLRCHMDDFLPETIEYFEKTIKKRFSEYS